MRFQVMLQYWLVVAVVTMVAAGAVSIASGGVLPNQAYYFFGPAFALSPLFARIAYKYVEPVIYRRMLDRAIAASGAEHGVVLGNVATSVVRVLGLALEKVPPDESLIARVRRTDQAAAASIRMVAVRAADGLQIRGGRSGKSVLVGVPDGRFRIEPTPGVAKLTLLGDEGEPIVAIPVMRIRRRLLKPATIAEAIADLALDDETGAAPPSLSCNT